MAELFLIRGETLEAASDKIREKLGLEETNQFSPTAFPTKIEEVYNAGYEAGSGSNEGGETDTPTPILYGTYILASNPNFTLPSKNISQSLENCEAYTYFYNGTNYEYSEIYSIDVRTNGSICLNYDGDGWFSTDYSSSNGWHAYCDDYYTFPDQRYKVMDFKQSVEVSQEFYDLFMGIVDNNNETLYGVGYDVGYSDGRDSAVMDYTPLIIQAEATQKSSSSSKFNVSGVYDVGDFVNKTVGGVEYNYTDTLSFGEAESSSRLTRDYTVTITNHHPCLFVQVYILIMANTTNASGIISGESSYLSTSIAPNSSGSVVGVTSLLGTLSWDYSVEFLKWSTTEVAATSEATETSEE